MTAKDPRRSGDSRSIPILVAVIGAAATVAAAFIGNTGGFSAVLPGAPAKIVTASAKPQVTVTVTKAAGVPTQPPGIYHEGPLTLTGDGQADLDAPPSDPQWGVINLTPGDSYSIEEYGNTAIFLENGAQGVQLKSAGNDTCANVTGYSTDRLGIDTQPLKVGQYICVHTAGGRFSLLQITGLPADGINLDVQTFKGPND